MNEDAEMEVLKVLCGLYNIMCKKASSLSAVNVNMLGIAVNSQEIAIATDGYFQLLVLPLMQTTGVLYSVVGDYSAEYQFMFIT